MLVSFFRTLPLLVVALLGASCSPKAPVQVVIRGSTTFGDELAAKLIAEYKKDHPLIIFDTEFKGTPYGFGALMVDKCDIAAASREVSTNELGLARERDIEFNTYVVGYYSVAVIANAVNPLTTLKPTQVHDLFTGKIENWKDLGGPDLPVHLYIRDSISGTYLCFRELAMNEEGYAPHPKTFTSYEGIVAAVARDPAGVGFASVQDVRKSGVKGFSIGGLMPTIAAVQKGEYPYARLLWLYTIKAKESEATADFIHFVESDRGQKVLGDMGFVPHS